MLQAIRIPTITRARTRAPMVSHCRKANQVDRLIQMRDRISMSHSRSHCFTVSKMLTNRVMMPKTMKKSCVAMKICNTLDI